MENQALAEKHAIKIRILTWLRYYNYGTVLQAYALQRCLRDRGYDVRNVDYLAGWWDKLRNMWCLRYSFRFFWERCLGKLQRWFFRTAHPQGWDERKRMFDQFLEQNMRLVPPISESSDLKKLNRDSDVFITGSDQVWAPFLFNPPYFLHFVEPGKRKIGYACSFGRNKISKWQGMRIRKYLLRFDAISVREKSGEAILESLLHQPVRVNVDPSMLLTAKEWNQVAAPRKVDEAYMFCYFLSYNAAYWEKCEHVARERGLKLVYIPILPTRYPYGVALPDTSPGDWLSLVKHAAFVATDSFHGCVFSLIFQKNFMVFKRFDDRKVTSQNTRVYHLLDTYSVRQCLVEDVASYRPYSFTKEEYEEVAHRIAVNAEQSKQWLDAAILNV